MSGKTYLAYSASLLLPFPLWWPSSSEDQSTEDEGSV